jgi:hypothetical protein
VLYEELKRRNNFNTTNSENEIVGNWGVKWTKVNWFMKYIYSIKL